MLPNHTIDKTCILQKMDDDDGFEPRNKLEKRVTELLRKSGVENEEGIIELEDALAMKVCKLNNALAMENVK